MMPIVGFFTGGIDFSDIKIVLVAGADAVIDANGAVVTEAVAENAIKICTSRPGRYDLLVYALSVS